MFAVCCRAHTWGTLTLTFSNDSMFVYFDVNIEYKCFRISPQTRREMNTQFSSCAWRIDFKNIA